jgi:hypothetical protein
MISLRPRMPRQCIYLLYSKSTKLEAATFAQRSFEKAISMYMNELLVQLQSIESSLETNRPADFGILV